MSPCIFCQVVQGELDSEIVQEDDRTLAFKDVNPQAPTHILIIPKEPIARLVDATEDHAALLGHLLLLSGKVTRMLGIDDAFRLVINNGEAAGQTVFHLHLHILANKSFAETGLGKEFS